MRPSSLAFRLVASSAAWSLLVLLFTGFLLSSLFRSAVERTFDERLILTLDGLLASVEIDEKGELTETDRLGDTRYVFPLQGWYWQVSVLNDPSGRNLRSGSLLEKRLELPPTVFEPRDENGLSRFYFAGPEGNRLRVIEQKYSIDGTGDQLSFIVTGNADELNAEIDAFDQALFISLGVLAVGLLAVVLVQVWFAVQPLRRLREGLADVRSGKEERLQGEFPLEIQPVVRELNALLQSNWAVLERARTQVGNLAHALKTPLSIIKNEAHASDPGSGAKIVEQAAVMADQVDLYLDRARRAARARTLGAISDVRPVVLGLIRTLERLYGERNITVSVDCEDGLRFSGERQDLEEMIGNLLDNAFKWASSTVAVSVRKTRPKGEGQTEILIITVDDDGPGLPAEHRDEALQRGRRLDETKPGSGLGLSIVAETADMYDGSISLAPSASGGLQAALTLPSVRSRGL